MPASDSPPACVGLPEATHETATWCERQQQLALAAARHRRRGSVILDAADEALFKLNRQQASRKPADVLTPPQSPSTRNSMDSQDGFRQPGQAAADGPVPQSFYDSFRWMDEEEDLDLRLFLDDYHANLRESAPTTKQRPSFRRHMSVSKIPFGRRSSVSSTLPHDAMSPASPVHSPPESISNGPTHTRRKSRALSLLGPKYDAQPAPLAVFDPSAAHYQDPEARLKLRVYLASPQKFDEAVEFGFPSADADTTTPAPHPQAPSKHHHKHTQTTTTNMRTFLADDIDSDSSADEADALSLHSSNRPSSSLNEPDSPKTPEPFEHHHHHQQQHSNSNKPRHNRFASVPLSGAGRKTPEPGFPGASREMTLRMTLTRPDLRAREDEIYGWQQQQGQAPHGKVVYHQQGHARRATALGALATGGERNGGNQGGYYGAGRESMEPFPELDHWNESGVGERGVMRRIWARVRRG